MVILLLNATTRKHHCGWVNSFYLFKHHCRVLRSGFRLHVYILSPSAARKLSHYFQNRLHVPGNISSQDIRILVADYSKSILKHSGGLVLCESQA